MPVQQFNAYDLIVDIIPGVLTLALLILLLPKQIASGIYATNPLIAGSALLLLGFVTGRMIHAAASSLTDRPISTYLLGEPVPLAYSLKLGITIEEEEESGEDAILDDIDPGVLVGVVDELRNRMNRTGFFPNNPTPKAMTKYGENLLYGEDTLYHRYEMLTTFYRSLTLISGFGILVFASYAIGVQIIERPVYGMTAQYSPWLYFLITYTLVGMWTVARSRCQVFAKRRARAFVNDIHQLESAEGLTQLRDSDLNS